MESGSGARSALRAGTRAAGCLSWDPRASPVGGSVRGRASFGVLPGGGTCFAPAPFRGPRVGAVLGSPRRWGHSGARPCHKGVSEGHRHPLPPGEPARVGLGAVMDPVVLDAGGRGTEQLLKRGHQSTRESRETAPLRCEDRWCRRLGWSQVRPAGPLLPAQPHSDTRARPAAATRDPERGSSPSVSLQNSLPWKPPHSENGGGSRPLCSPAAL